MPGAWKKTLSYLGLVEEEEDEEIQDLPEEPISVSQSPSRRFGHREPVAVAPAPEPHHTTIRTMPQPRPAAASTIHKAEPKRFNEARDLGDKFREGIPVIMNLQ